MLATYACTAAGPLILCATCLRPPSINLNSLSVPPTMDRPTDDCEGNLKETMSLFNNSQGGNNEEAKVFTLVELPLSSLLTHICIYLQQLRQIQKDTNFFVFCWLSQLWGMQFLVQQNLMAIFDDVRLHAWTVRRDSSKDAPLACSCV